MADKVELIPGGVKQQVLLATRQGKKFLPKKALRKVTTGDLGTAGSEPTNPIDATTGERLNRAPDFQNPVRLLKGALIAYDPETQQTGERVNFQYNPEQLTRTLTPTYKKDEEGKLFIGAPGEKIDLTIKLQAVDLMVAKSKKQDLEASGRGLYAQLATLELLVYPESSAISKYQQELESGTKGTVPASAKPLMFQWGPRRLLPVRLTSVTVTETLFNIALSPIVATVKLDMEIESITDAMGLTYDLLFQHVQDMESIAEYESVTIGTNAGKVTVSAG